MTKFILALLVSVLPLVASDLTLRWNFNFSGAPICSATVTTNCYEAFEATLVYPTPVVYTIPIQAGASGNMVDLTHTKTGLTFPPPGLYAVQLVMLSRSSTGAVVRSRAALAAQNVPPPPPSDLQVLVPGE